MLDPRFASYLARWDLSPDGAPFSTATSQLLPVRRGDLPAMLKVTSDSEERHGGAVMAWWNGGGAAPVLAHEEGAVLMERAMGDRSLLALVRDDRDEEATRIICQVAAHLHAPRPQAPPSFLAPLETWFEPLAATARAQGGLFHASLGAARRLLPQQQEVTVLHGDLHHENILDFGDAGWLALDPKRVIGDRAFEYAILFCDPDLGPSGVKAATRPEIFNRRIEVVSAAAGLDPHRLLSWILAWTGLSAAWTLEDDGELDVELTVGAMAAAALGV